MQEKALRRWLREFPELYAVRPEWHWGNVKYSIYAKYAQYQEFSRRIWPSREDIEIWVKFSLANGEEMIKINITNSCSIARAIIDCPVGSYYISLVIIVEREGDWQKFTIYRYPKKPKEYEDFHTFLRNIAQIQA